MVCLGPFLFVASGTTWIRLLIIFSCEPLGRMKAGQGDLGIPWWTRMILDRLLPCLMWSFFAPFFPKHCLNTSIRTNPFLFRRAYPSVHNFPFSYSIFDSSHKIHQVSELYKSIDYQHVIIWRGQSVHEHGIFFSTGEGWSNHWCRILPPDCIFFVIFLWSLLYALKGQPI